MTEEEWLTSGDTSPMLNFLKEKTSNRKMRLLTCAFCSHIKGAADIAFFHTAFDIAESFADGQVKWEQVSELATQINCFSRHTDFLQQAAAVLPVYLLNENVRYAAWGSATHAWNHAPAVRHKIVASNVAYMHDIVGNPFRPVNTDAAWLTSTVLPLARQIYASRDFTTMPILADALQDAGCENADVLSHCRGEGPHVRGCWVVDLLLGKE